MRKRLIAIPYSASKFGVRLDWSPAYHGFVLYIWGKGKIARAYIGRKVKIVGWEKLG